MFYRSNNEEATIVLFELRLALIRSHPMPTFDNELAKKRGGLNRSMQHWLAVYSPAFQSPKLLAGVD